MVADWYQAQATCESKGKRLCWASEWTAACEGPEHTPFPYGWERDHGKCNFDNFYIDPWKRRPRAKIPLPTRRTRPSRSGGALPARSERARAAR